jgi:G:T-mismatch repair DNA endonuclease (very short patch repair protein)
MGDRKHTLEERLQAHPRLRDRFHQILSIAEDAEGKVDKADEAEERVIEELRKLGQEVLQDWAVGKEKQKVEQVKKELDRKIKGHGKKNFAGTQHLEK